MIDNGSRFRCAAFRMDGLGAQICISAPDTTPSIHRRPNKIMKDISAIVAQKYCVTYCWLRYTDLIRKR
jgi:hypothetical protein